MGAIYVLFQSFLPPAFLLSLFPRLGVEIPSGWAFPEQPWLSRLLRRFWKVSRSWCCQTDRTPLGEINEPSLRNSLEPLCWPKAGLSSAIFNSISGSTRFLGIRSVQADNITKCKFATFLIKLFETVKAVSGITKDFTRLCYVAKLTTQLPKSLLMIFASRFIWSSFLFLMLFNIAFFLVLSDEVLAFTVSY